MENLEVGTKVRVTGACWVGYEGEVERTYTIRHGHRMYDVRGTYGNLMTYLGRGQLETLEEQEG